MLSLEKRELIKGILLIGLAGLLIVCFILDLYVWGNLFYYCHALRHEIVGKVCIFSGTPDCFMRILVAHTVFVLFTFGGFLGLVLLILKSGRFCINKYEKGEINHG